MEVELVPDNARTHAILPQPLKTNTMTCYSSVTRYSAPHDSVSSGIRECSRWTSDCCNSFNSLTCIRSRPAAAAAADGDGDKGGGGRRRHSIEKISSSQARLSTVARPRLLSRWGSDPGMNLYLDKNEVKNLDREDTTLQKPSPRKSPTLLEPPTRSPSLILEIAATEDRTTKSTTKNTDTACSSCSRWNMGIDRQEKSPDQMKQSHRYLNRRTAPACSAGDGNSMVCQPHKRRPSLCRWDSDSRMSSSDDDDGDD